MIFVSLKGKSYVLFVTIFFLFLSIGYFIKTDIPGFSIVGYDYISTIYLLIYLFFKERKNIRLEAKNAFLFILFGFSLLASMFGVVDENIKNMYMVGFNLISKSDATSYYTLRIFIDITILFLVISFVKSCFTKEQLKKVFYYSFFTFVMIAIIIGLFEYFLGLSFRLGVINFLGYYERNVSLVEMFRFNEKGISSLTKEPSLFALYLSLGLMVINKYKNNILITLLIFVFIVLSSSTLGFMYMFFYIGISILMSVINKTNTKYFYLLGLLVGIGILYYFYPHYFNTATQRISFLFNSKQNAIGSEDYRLWTIKNMFQYFKMSPFFGLGFNHIMVFSGVISFFYEVGFFGVACYLFVFFHNIRVSKSNFESFAFVFLIILFTSYSLVDVNLWIIFLYFNTFQQEHWVHRNTISKRRRNFIALSKGKFHQVFEVQRSMTKKRQMITICDTLAKYDVSSKLPYGHYLEIFKQYASILGDSFSIQIATTKRYAKFLNQDLQKKVVNIHMETPCNILGSKLVKGLVDKNKYAIHFLNMIRCLNLKTDILIFQSYPSVIYFLPLLFYRGRKKIFQIVYKNVFLGSTTKNFKTILKNFCVALLLKGVSRNLAGVIASTEETASFFRKVEIKAVVIPDYLMSGEDSRETEDSQTYRYDIAILGTNSIHKNLMDVINSCKNKKVTVIIAGKFTAQDLYKEVMKIKYKNIKVVNQYISPTQYHDIIRCSRYIAFPYTEHNYTSGVFFEALYNSKPIVCSETLFAGDVKNNKLGFVYKTSIAEFLEQNISDDEYKCMVDNIKKYVKFINQEAKGRLLNFLLTDIGVKKNESTAF